MGAADDAWDGIRDTWLARPGIGTKKMLREVGLCGPAGKVFASLLGDRLMVKLPAGRVQELIADGAGQPMTTGRGPMREWVTAGPELADTWPDLVAEAHGFVG